MLCIVESHKRRVWRMLTAGEGYSFSWHKVPLISLHEKNGGIVRAIGSFELTHCTLLWSHTRANNKKETFAKGHIVPVLVNDHMDLSEAICRHAAVIRPVMSLKMKSKDTRSRWRSWKDANDRQWVTGFRSTRVLFHRLYRCSRRNKSLPSAQRSSPSRRVQFSLSKPSFATHVR